MLTNRQKLWSPCSKMKNVFHFSNDKVQYTKPQSVYFFTPLKYTKPQSVYFFYSLKYTKPQSVYFNSIKYTVCHTAYLRICAGVCYYDKCTYIQSVYYTLSSVNSKIKIKKNIGSDTLPLHLPVIFNFMEIVIF